MSDNKLTSSNVAHIAKLAHIPVTGSEEAKLAIGFNTTIKVVDKLFKVDVTNVVPTSQVTGLENIFREDVVDVERQFSQDEALLNAKRTYNGFFVVDQVIEQDE
jgi:aspartyl-tRNA(Asn)/glutamyl-tRNA(Gln) amidotransferase subunit C